MSKVIKNRASNSNVGADKQQFVNKNHKHYINTNPATNRAQLPFHIANVNSNPISHRSLMQDSCMNQILNTKQLQHTDMMGNGSKRQSLARENGSKKASHLSRFDKSANKENIYTGNVSRERSPLAYQQQQDPKGKLTQRTSIDNRHPSINKKKYKKSKNNSKKPNNQNSIQNNYDTLQTHSSGVNCQNSIMHFNSKNEQKKLVQKLKQTSKSKNFAHLSNFFLSSTLTQKQSALQGSSGIQISTNNNNNICQMSQQLASQNSNNNHHLLLNSSQPQLPYYLLANTVNNHRSPQNIKTQNRGNYLQTNSTFNFVNKQSPQTLNKNSFQTLNSTGKNEQILSNNTTNRNNLHTIQLQYSSNNNNNTNNSTTLRTSQKSSTGRKSLGNYKTNSMNGRKNQTINQSSSYYGLIASNYNIGLGPTSRNQSPTETTTRNNIRNVINTERKVNQFLKIQQQQASQIKRVNLSTKREQENILKHLSAQQSRKRLLLTSHYEGSPPQISQKQLRKSSANNRNKLYQYDSQSSTIRGRQQSASKNKKQQTNVDQQNSGVVKKDKYDNVNKHLYSCTPLNQQQTVTKIQMINNFMNNVGSPQSCSSRTRPDLMSTNASQISNSMNKNNNIGASCLSVIKEKSRQSFGHMFQSNGKDAHLQGSAQRVSTERSINLNNSKPPLNNFSTSPKNVKPKIPSCRPSQMKLRSQINSEQNSIKRRTSAKKQHNDDDTQKYSKLQTESLINFYQKLTGKKKNGNMKYLINKEQLNKLIKAIKNESMPKMIQDIESTMSKEKDQRRQKQSTLRNSIENNNLYDMENGPIFNNRKITQLNSDIYDHLSIHDTNSEVCSQHKVQSCNQLDNKMYQTFKHRDEILEAAIFGGDNTKQQQQQYPNSLRSSNDFILSEGQRVQYMNQNNLLRLNNSNKFDKIDFRNSTMRQQSMQYDMMKPIFKEQDSYYISNEKYQHNLLQKTNEDNITTLPSRQQQILSQTINMNQNQTLSSINNRVSHIEQNCNMSPTTRKNNNNNNNNNMILQVSPMSDYRQETPLHNTFIGNEEMQKIIEAKLHLHQFEKVFCKDKLQQNNLSIQDYENYDEQNNNVSGITDFSLEFEMLNKLHVDKNTVDYMKDLPILNEQLLPDLECSLYQEQYQNGKILKFTKDNRNKIQFKDPYKGKPKMKIDKKRLQEIIKNNNQILNEQSYIHNQANQSPFMGNDNIIFSMKEQSSWDNLQTIKYEVENNNNNMSYSNNFNPQQLQNKQSFQMFQEISDIRHAENNYYQQEAYDGVPQIVNLSDSEQIITDGQFNRVDSINQQNQEQYNPFLTVLKYKKSSDMIYNEGINCGPSKRQFENNNNILLIQGTSSQRPSSCNSNTLSHSSQMNETNYMAQKILGKDSFDELESIKEDSNIYFGNAPIKKGIHQRFLSRNSNMTSQSVNIASTNKNVNNDMGFGMFSRDYEKNSFQGIIKIEEQQQQQQKSRQIHHVKQSSSFMLNRQLFNSIKTPIDQSIQFDSFIIPEDTQQLQQQLNIQQLQDYQRISCFRDMTFPIFNGMPVMQMQVYNAMNWFDPSQKPTALQIDLEYFNFDNDINNNTSQLKSYNTNNTISKNTSQKQYTSVDNTIISPSSYESRNFPTSSSQNDNKNNNQEQIIKNQKLICEEKLYDNNNNNDNNNDNINHSPQINTSNTKRLSYPYSNQSSNNKYKRRQQPQQHPESRITHHRPYYLIENSDQKYSTATLMMMNEGYKVDDEESDNDNAADIEETPNLLSESYTL